MNRAKDIDKSAILVGLIILIILVTSVFIYLQVRSDKITDTIQQKAPISILFVISDGEKSLFSEIFVFNPVTHEGSILDIPGDLGLIIQSLKRYDRIDVLYKKGNIKPLRETIQKFAGIPVPFYIELNLDNLERLIDLLDGIEIFIANPVEALDQDPPVLLPPGSVLLDGKKVRRYLSYSDPSDTRADGVGRRQKLLQSLLRSVGGKSEYLMHDRVFSYFHDSISSNLDQQALKSLLRELLRFDAENVLFHQVLGTERAVDEQQLLFPHFDGELFRSRVKQIVETLADTEKSEDSGQAVTLQILNGTMISGFASRTEKLFQGFGYNDAIVANADRTDYANTVVIDRRGNIVNAQKVADIIKCKKVESIPDSTIDGRIDITIILGKDFDGRYCK